MECTIGIQYMYLLVGVFRIYTLVNNWQSQSGGWVSEKHPGASTISNLPLDGDLTSHGWQMRAPSHEPPHGMGEA